MRDIAEPVVPDRAVRECMDGRVMISDILLLFSLWVGAYGLRAYFNYKLIDF